MLGFGAGTLFGVQTFDANGAAVANPTPVQFGVLQDVSMDLTFEEKLLYGAKQFPVAFGRGKGKISAKAKFANVDGRLLGDLVLGGGTTSSIKALNVDQAGSVPGVSAYTITPTVPSSGTWVADLGVKDALTNLPMTRVASGPTTGQYSVAAGVYTFAAADANKAVLISYEYSATSTTAKVVTLTNRLMGYAPFFKMAFDTQYFGKKCTMVFTRVSSNKIAFPFKNDDFMIPEMEMSIIADDSDSLGYIALAE